MEDCLFCKIIAGKIPSEKVFENEFVLAFKDIAPAAPVHILVVPKLHIQDTNHITSENISYISEIYQAIEKIASICNIKESGYRIICNCGKDGMQEVPHLHFHLLGGKQLGEKIVG